MNLDFGKLKEKLLKGKSQPVGEKEALAAQPGTEKPSPWLNNAAAADIKRGLEDVQVVAHERKYNLFIKQFIVLLVVFLGVKFICGKFSQSKAQIKDKVASINIQQTNKEDYLDNKQHLLQLEPLFPDIAQKNDWVLKQLISIFRSHDMTPDVDGNVSEASEKTYVVFAQPVTFQNTFPAIGKLIADIENGDDFLRISDISITKKNAPEDLGENTVKIIFSTIFPKEKYGPKLFKDYAQQMKKIQDEKDAAKKNATPAPAGGRTK